MATPALNIVFSDNSTQRMHPNNPRIRGFASGTLFSAHSPSLLSPCEQKSSGSGSVPQYPHQIPPTLKAFSSSKCLQSLHRTTFAYFARYLKFGHFSSALLPFKFGSLSKTILNKYRQASQCKHSVHLAIPITIHLCTAVGAVSISCCYANIMEIIVTDRAMETIRLSVWCSLQYPQPMHHFNGIH